MMRSAAAQRQALRTLQYRANLSIDAIWQSVPDEVEALVLRHATRQPDGSLRITPLGKTLILAELERVLTRLEPVQAQTIHRAVVQAAGLAQEAMR